MKDYMNGKSISDSFYQKSDNKYFSDNMKRRNYIFSELINFIKNKLNSKHPFLLDIGGGEGYISSLIGKYCKIINIDIDVQKLKLSKTKNVNFQINADAHKLPIKKHSINVIILWSVLDHMDDINKVIYNVKNLLTKDGILIIYSNNFFYYKKLQQRDKLGHIHRISFNYLHKLLTNNNFKIIKFIGNNFPCQFHYDILYNYVNNTNIHKIFRIPALLLSNPNSLSKNKLINILFLFLGKIIPRFSYEFCIVIKKIL